MAFFGGELDLRQHHGNEHQSTADILPQGHLLVQDDGTGDDGEHALQTQQDGDHRGVGILLGQNLQGVAHAAGEHAHVQQGQDALPKDVEAMVSKIRARMVDQIAANRNCRQESFTPSQRAVKWSMRRMCTAKHTAHTSTSRSPGAREKLPLMHSRYRDTTLSTTAIHRLGTVTAAMTM